jgi:hypothetical protein
MAAKKKIWGRLVIGILSLLAALALAGFSFPRQILCVDSGDVHADALVVLGGGGLERPSRAAELFHSGTAPRIVVPASAIELECNSKTTRENAEFSIALLRKRGAKSAIIVTSWYHSRRALRCFRHYGPDIQFYSRPSCVAYTRAEWRGAGSWGYIRSEYEKLVGYWLRFGICPF